MWAPSLDLDVGLLADRYVAGVDRHRAPRPGQGHDQGGDADAEDDGQDEEGVGVKRCEKVHGHHVDGSLRPGLIGNRVADAPVHARRA